MFCKPGLVMLVVLSFSRYQPVLPSVPAKILLAMAITQLQWLNIPASFIQLLNVHRPTYAFSLSSVRLEYF